MAHALVSTVLKELGSVIFKEAEKEVRLVLGTPQEVENFTSTLKSIQAVLIDAEEKQVKEETVKLWLEKLKDVAYDLEDVLDEWSIEILRSENEEDVGVLEKVCSYLFSLCNCNWNCFSQFSLRRGIGHKINEIKGKLDVIAKEKDQFQLINSGMRITTTAIAEPPTFRMTSSLIDILQVRGRDDDKDIILSKLLSESSQQQTPNVLPIVISICGPGGIGKTTLAQMVYNDDEVKTHFEKTMWVCVSDPFDLTRLAKAIIKAAGDAQNVSNNIEWQDLHQELCRSVTGKRFLLVLDDVWTENHTDWDQLKLALKGGAQGSRIVVTTRIKKVALMMDSAYTYDLGKLSEEKCLELFESIAFRGWSKEECEKVKDMGVNIVKKCQGVPLFVKALGGLLFFKKTRSKWEQVLNSDAWELQNVAKEVLPILLLSYYDLPSNLKRCFMYCAVLPKDHRIKKDDLIKLWMAHGLLNSMRSTELEVVGTEYFDELLMRSFFQNMERDDDGNIIYCKMHDLIHDFAQFLTKTECFIMDGNNMEFNNNSKKVRHLNITWFTYLSSILPSIYEAKNLRTLIIDRRRQAWASESSPALSDLFCQLTCLRELSLCIPNLEELPNEVEKLIHLRYLELSGTQLKELPETMSRLYNLQTLKLTGCKRLRKLPQGIGAMINLRHLEIEKTKELSYLPQGIGRLSSLRSLSKFIVSDARGGGCKIGELKDLNHLEGDLEIFGLERVADVNETNEAKLKNKRHLHGLKLIFECNQLGNMGEGEIKRIEGVLADLQPHRNLKELQIRGYLGSKFPNWMDDSMLPNLVAIEIVDCIKCIQFPALGNLPVLERLKIIRMNSMKRVGVEFLGINVDVDDDGTKRGGGESRVVVAFPQLKELTLLYMYELEEWEMLTREEEEEEEEHAAGSGGGRDIIIMPLLHTLYLGNCPKLKELPHYIFPASLRTFYIEDCPKLSWTPCLPPLLEELELEADVGVLSRSLPTNQVNNSNNNLKSLIISFSPHSSLPEGLAHLTSLQRLSIEYSNSLMCMSEELKQLTSLQSLEIFDCSVLGARCQKEVGEDWSIISHIPNIASFSVPALSNLFCQFTCLRELSLCIWNLEELPNEVEKLIHLRYFDLSGTQLKELPETMSRLYNLQTLKLTDCSSLRKLPQGIGKMINLRHLEIERTDELSYLPQGIGRLSSLRSLCKFIVSDARGGGCKIGELEDLNHLEGDLEIFGLERVADVNETNEAQLKNKRHLHGLKLIFECNWMGNMGVGEIKRIEGVLADLQPHQNLKELQIRGYLGSKFPNWMDDSMLPNLVAIEIVDCIKCMQFPAIGNLPVLESLYISGMDSVKRVGVEFLGINVDVDDDGTKRDGGESRVVVAFPQLKDLTLSRMYNLEEWDLRVEDGVIMSCLRKLYLWSCPKLQVLPALGNLPVLESLRIEGMDSVKCVGVEFLGINVDVDDDGTKRGDGESRVVVAFPQLKDLTLYEMDELEEWDLRIEDGVIMPCLRNLSLRSCPKLQVLPALGNLPVLERLDIEGMKSVKRVGVEFLGINVDVDDDGTKRGGGESRVVVAFPQLKQLYFKHMYELEEWEMLTREEEEDAAGSGGGRDIITIMPLLHTLSIQNCPKLKEPPHYIFPASLRELTIGYCPKLSWTPCLPPLLEELNLGGDVGVLSRSLPINQVNNSNNNLKSLTINNSPYSSLPEGLAHLTSLQRLSISFCDSLMCMSEELKQLTSLQSLEILYCSVLGARCQEEVGEDWSIISHIPNINITRRRGE